VLDYCRRVIKLEAKPDDVKIFLKNPEKFANATQLIQQM